MSYGNWQRESKLPSFQRSEYRQQFLPEVDHRLAVWQAYLNCVNAFQGSDMLGGSEQGGSVNFTRTTQERFVYHLGVLDSLLDQDKDEDFKKQKPVSLPDLLDGNLPNEFGRFDKFSDFFRYWTRIDMLMRRQGFYTTAKLDMGHL